MNIEEICKFEDRISFYASTISNDKSLEMEEGLGYTNFSFNSLSELRKEDKNCEVSFDEGYPVKYFYILTKIYEGFGSSYCTSKFPIEILELDKESFDKYMNNLKDSIKKSNVLFEQSKIDKKRKKDEDKLFKLAEELGYICTKKI